METQRMCVIMLFVLLLLVSSTDAFLSDPVICYMLDGFLVIYCIVATGFYFREKLASLSEADSAYGEQESNGIYQDLQRPEGTDIYQEIDSKARKQVHKKKKQQVKESLQADSKDKDAYEALSPTASPLPPQ